ncbi:uncharacterized protein LOC122328180 [Puntigrus tetrazona]|uniref:uncharacterized protein LOC122328180 n=1 Tax=Puntigrus tetrazona TaxID=1606681 RepID=UPI001C88F787|nr:uncharacterized protein LOC122328180 [Puntigrus tetrazona]
MTSKTSKELLRKVHEFVKGTATFPLSLLLIGVEKLIEVEFFSCPCRVEQNALLTSSVFIGPALFLFTLMHLVFRPFRYGCSSCGGANHNNQPNDSQQSSADNAQSTKTQSCPKAFASCLIPPVIWIFILLLDGEYVACSMTDWKGVYVFDQELNKFWCNPTEKIQNVTELRDLTHSYIHQSQFSQYAGYILISVFSALTFVFVSIHDCCISGKCADYCPDQLLCCRQTTETQSSSSGHRPTPSSSVPSPTQSSSGQHPTPSSSVPSQTPSSSVPSQTPSSSVPSPTPSSSGQNPTLVLLRSNYYSILLRSAPPPSSSGQRPTPSSSGR